MEYIIYNQEREQDWESEEIVFRDRNKVIKWLRENKVYDDGTYYIEEFNGLDYTWAFLWFDAQVWESK